MRIGGGKLYKCMIRYILEIFLVTFLVTVSYYVFTSGNLSSYAQIAEASQKANDDLEILYKSNSSLSDEYLLDSGTLSIKNPNSHIVSTKTDIKIDADSLIDISLIDVVINGEKLPKESFVLSEGYYVSCIEKNEIEARNSLLYNVKIYGDALYVNTNIFSYHFEVTQGFYS